MDKYYIKAGKYYLSRVISKTFMFGTGQKYVVNWLVFDTKKDANEAVEILRERIGSNKVQISETFDPDFKLLPLKVVKERVYEDSIYKI